MSLFSRVFARASPPKRAASSASVASGKRAPIGTTIVSALVHGNELAVAWVGDSRAYWVTERGEEQLTTDHAEERELTSCLGMVDDRGRAAHVEPSVVTRTVGKQGALI